MAAAWNDLPDSGELTECAALVRSAEALCPGAPELAVQLARRALVVGASESATLAGAGRSRSLAVSLSMRAQAVLAAGLVRVSQHVDAVEPAFAALALADAAGVRDVAVSVRLDLSTCAREIGEPLLGGALLRPVLETEQVRSSVRAVALGRFIGCVAHVARRDDVEDALVEADRLLAADDGLSPDTRRMERARLSVRSAAYHRWYGDTEDAITSARDGLNLLSRLRPELRAESDRVRARLVFELVCALLDEGELDGAESEAAPLVDAPVRATSADAVGQVMLAIATRVHLPSGHVERGRRLLDQAAWLAERHHIDSVLADALTELSRLDEQAGSTAEALAALRNARAAEQRRLRDVTRASRRILTELGSIDAVTEAGQEALTALLHELTQAGRDVPATRSPLPPPRTSPEPHGQPPDPVQHTDEATGLLNREGLFRRLRSVRNGERPVALTLVRIDRSGGPGSLTRADPIIDLTQLAGRVRAIAPANAELARSDGGELAVLLPHTTKDQAERFAATIRETAVESAWLTPDAAGAQLSLSTGVVQSAMPTPGTEDRVDATALLTAARNALIPVQLGSATPQSQAATAAILASALAENPPARQPEQPESALSEETPTRPLTDVTRASESLTIGRSILSSLSIPTGSGGKRRAEGERSGWPTETSASTVARRPTESPTRASELSTGASQQPTRASEPIRPEGPPPTPELPTDEPTQRSSYEQTKAELARMMSALTSGSLKVPPPQRDEPGADPNSTYGSRPTTASTPGSDDPGTSAHPGRSASDHPASDPGAPFGGDHPDRSASDRSATSGDYPGAFAGHSASDRSVTSGDFPGAFVGQSAGDHRDRGATGGDFPGAFAGQSAGDRSDRSVGDRGATGGDFPGAFAGQSAGDRSDRSVSDRGVTSGDFSGAGAGISASDHPGTATGDSGGDHLGRSAVGGSASDHSGAEPDQSGGFANPGRSAVDHPGTNPNSESPEPGNPLFDASADTPPASRWSPRAPFKSSLAAAFESFDTEPEQPPDPEPAQPPDPAQELGPLQGPEPRPHDLPPRRERSDSTTIAGLLAEALAAYQSTTDEDDEHEAPPRLPDLTAPGQPEPPKTPSETPPKTAFSELREQSGVTGRHRSPE